MSNIWKTGRGLMGQPLTVLMAVLLIFILAACASDAPEDAVTGYFNALVEGDEATARSLTCAEWESIAVDRIASFTTLDARMDGMACSVDGEVDDGTRVVCDGAIVITYDTSDQQLDLGAYKVVQEGGAWRMCGETE